MRNFYWIAPVAVLLILGITAWRDVDRGPQLAQPQQVADNQTADPSRPATIPGIPGITGPDQTPDGCVDCHGQVDATGDFRLSTIIKELADEGKHPDTSEQTKTEELPNNCVTCHSSESSIGLANLIHEEHYEDDDNTFITKYEGQCLHCHSLDREEGIIDIKSGREQGAA